MKIAELFESEKPTAEAVWAKMLKGLFVEDLDDELNAFETAQYNKHLHAEEPIKLVNELMTVGVDFSNEDTLYHWIQDLAGAFIVTHEKYKSPKHADSEAGKKLAKYVREVVYEPYNKD